LTSGGNSKNTNASYFVAASDNNFISQLDDVGRFGGAAINRDTSCFTNFLGYSAPRTEPTRFKEEVEAHETDERSRRQGPGQEFKGIVPASCP
jgi:hypothetical protein